MSVRDIEIDGVAMRIGIRTLYNSENCGSFWQAYALGLQLRRMGHTVGYLKRPTSATSHGKGRYIKNCIKALVKEGMSGPGRVTKTHLSFSKAVASLNVIDDDPAGVDVVVLGSDTIWQLELPYFRKNLVRYWGLDILGSTDVIAYAPSIANSPLTLFDRPETRRALSAMKAIGVRDGYTRETLQHFTEKAVVEVCDPTLLLTADDYLKLTKAPREGKYLFSYYFLVDKAPDALLQEVRRYADEHELEIISYFGGQRSFGVPLCSVDPFEFLGLMANASAVVTNTFHGTLFSQIFGKRTIFNSSGKNKVRDVLSKLGLEHCDFASASSKEKLFEREVDRSRVYEAIARMRESSQAFLRDALR